MKKRGATIFLVLLCGLLVWQTAKSVGSDRELFERYLYKNVAKDCTKIYCPVFLYTDSGQTQTGFKRVISDITQNTIFNMVPLYGFVKENIYTENDEECIESAGPQELYEDSSLDTLAQAVEKENQRLVSNADKDGSDTVKEEIISKENTENGTYQENKVKDENVRSSTSDVANVNSGNINLTKKQVVFFDEGKLCDTKYLKKLFYTEDPTTMIMDGQLNYNRLMEYDATLKQDSSQPQILIYHTHSKEDYADSNPEDAATTIMGVGEYLSAILRKDYGYNVLHHLGQYDLEGRDYAYSNAAAGLEKVLQDNPSIEVIIDLHRDAVKEGTRLVTTQNGVEMAQFMFFNGLCYTRQLGELTSLPNPYIQENIAFSFQMKLAAEEYYPGLTRKSYLKGYRYNLQYRPKSLLIELGAQTNTLNEAMNSCIPLAQLIDMVLSGENK